MAAVILDPPEQRWVCPNCTDVMLTHVDYSRARIGESVTPFHVCRGLRGTWVPFVAEGVACKVELVEREDYVRDEHVQRNAAGDVLMATRITRDEGQDQAVYAPCILLGRAAMDERREAIT